MVINIIVDIILLGIMVAGAVIGIKIGFIKVVAKPLKTILSLIIAFNLATALASGVIQPIIEEPVSNQITSYLYENCKDISEETLGDELPTLIKVAATIFNVDINNVSEGKEDIISAVVDSLTGPIIYIISVIISFVLLYFLSRILVSLAFSIVNAVFKSGVFGVLNKILGFVTCLMLAIFAAWTAAALFEYIIHLPGLAESSFTADFDGGFIYGFFKKYNPVELLLSF